MQAQEHLKMLGKKTVDKVTGFEGVITSISFDLYGCVQAIVTPETNAKGERCPGEWFDVTRLGNISDNAVMEVPDFSKGYIAEGKKGCAEKPVF